jgi:hypothetical protein
MSKNRICAMFVGNDGLMGLGRGQICWIKTEIKQNLLWVTWKDNSCPYPNLESFLESWEVLRICF